MKLSIVIPVYNAETYLNRCFNSIKKQDNFSELEIIIINDGSIDNSKNIISEFKRGNKNIIVKNIEHSGVSKARNVGIDLASCKYITFLDADDYVDHDYYVSLLNAANKSNGLIVYGFNVKYENSKVKIKRCINHQKVFYGEEIINEFLRGNSIGPNVWNKLFLTQIAKKIKFDENIFIAEDKWFVFQYLTKIKKVTVLPITKYNYVINKDSAIMQSFNKNKLHAIIISNRIKELVVVNYPNLTDLAYSNDIDTKCRIYCQIYNSKAKKEYQTEYDSLKKEIKNYPILKKFKNSNLKHFIGFVLMRISPKLYFIIQTNLKWKYKI